MYLAESVIVSGLIFKLVGPIPIVFQAGADAPGEKLESADTAPAGSQEAAAKEIGRVLEAAGNLEAIKAAAAEAGAEAHVNKR